MKKIKKIGGLVAVFLLNFYNKCSADVVWINPETGQEVGHSSPRFEPIIEPTVSQPNYILIGIFVLVIVICAVIIIRRIIKKKKEKSSDNK